MKTLLIVFAVLLLLLTLLSTFGGSIRPSEPFFQDAKQPNEYYYEAPFQSEQFTDSMVMPPPMSEEYESSPASYISEQYNNAPGVSFNGPTVALSENFDEEMPESIPVSMPTEEFQTVQKPPVPTSFGENYVNVPSIPEVPIMPNEKKASYTNAPPQSIQDGFMIEPFEEDKKVSFYASF